MRILVITHCITIYFKSAIWDQGQCSIVSSNEKFRATKKVFKQSTNNKSVDLFLQHRNIFVSVSKVSTAAQKK